ncbi:MAG TPA: aminotransferase class V-fold PLP-dependent enzyme, partial [Candidatus Wujingus californicus]
STDKLLGGPQGGIIAGKKRWLDLLKKNPLTRALRVGKLTIAGLEATLKQYLEEDTAVKKIPVINMLLTPLNVIEDRCKKIINKINPKIKSMLDISIVDGFSEMGGGSLPGERIPTRLISVYSKQLNAEELAMQLRTYTPPIFGRIEYGRILLDMRTVCDTEVEMIAAALEKISGFSGNCVV